jgi:hypothetical protein
MSAESNNIDCWHDTCTRLQRLDVVEVTSSREDVTATTKLKRACRPACRRRKI